ncbi:MAG: hypothetical protein JNM20_14045 [Rhizobiales bacterium]|nr:hypothetical protein [Hyphomicrobiales bacterium]
MAASSRKWRLAAAIAVLSLAVDAQAESFEQPPSFSAAKILGDAASGTNYVIVDPVPSDGYLRNYTLKTPAGVFTVNGDQMLFMRFKEFAALDALDKTASSERFAKAVLKAGLSPLEFAGNLITKPISTVENTVSGVGQFFDGIGSGVRNAGKSQDSTLASVTGAAKEKRLLAYQYGVDPYTDFKPLAERLNDLARASALGGLAVKGAFIAVPGAAGAVVSNVSTASSLNEAVRDNSAAQLLDANRKGLIGLGIKKDAVEKLLSNRNYTPVDAVAMVAALTQLRKLGGLDIAVSRAATARSRDIAYLTRRRIELIAAYQQKNGTLAGFVAVQGSPFPLCATRDNGIVGIFPFDAVSWTEPTSQVFAAMSATAKEQGATGAKLFAITGTATPLAKKKLAALGWELRETIAAAP